MASPSLPRKARSLQDSGRQAECLFMLSCCLCIGYAALWLVIRHVALWPCTQPRFISRRVPHAVKALQDRCQSGLALLAEVLGVVPLNTGILAPLIRVAMQALTVDGIPLLQGKATCG